MSATHDCKEELHQVGSRATPARLALLRVLEQAKMPLSVPELKKKLPRINEVTLYRILEALVVAGVVRQGSRHGSAHYEHASRPHHHHLVCSDCGFIPSCRVC